MLEKGSLDLARVWDSHDTVLLQYKKERSEAVTVFYELLMISPSMYSVSSTLSRRWIERQVDFQTRDTSHGQRIANPEAEINWSLDQQSDRRCCLSGWRFCVDSMLESENLTWCQLLQLSQYFRGRGLPVQFRRIQSRIGRKHLAQNTTTTSLCWSTPKQKY